MLCNLAYVKNESQSTALSRLIDAVNRETCKVHNLLQPFEVSNSHLFVILSTKNRNILLTSFYLPQMAKKIVDLTCFSSLIRHQSNDSMFHIGQVTQHVKEVAFARNTESGGNLHPVCSCSYPSPCFILSPYFIPSP